MQEFLEYVVRGLVQHPDAVSVTPVQHENTTVYETSPGPHGCGQDHRTPGRDDQRHSFAAAGWRREKGVRCSVEIIEDKAGQ